MSELRRAPVVVVGAGPAGCLAAIRLARAGIATRLVDRGQRTAFGETLSPEGRRALSRAGVWERMPSGIALRCDAIGTAWERSTLQMRSFVRNPYGPAWHLDRARFDAWLRSEATVEGVEVVTGNVRDVERRTEGWSVTLADGTRCAASFLVIATGRTGSLATKLARRSRLNSLHVIGGFDVASADTALLVEAVSTGWWYSMPLPDGRLFAGWMTDATTIDARDRGVALESSLNETIHTRTRVRCLRSVIARSASSSVLASAAGDSWIAIGDAALSRDPLSGDGIAAALRSGWDGAEAVLALVGGDISVLAAMRARGERALREYLCRRASAYRVQRRWEDSAFWNIARQAS